MLSSSFTHKYIIYFEGLVRENENIRFITNIVSSAKQSGWEDESPFQWKICSGAPRRFML